ncbi:hypothetical protein, partial [Marinitenerispora sediminis]|uniref:hypothetical protein n=1 Tax=Marinitenerispora sediminis TaxID=1931232 RepID=UPI0015F1B0C1
QPHVHQVGAHGGEHDQYRAQRDRPRHEHHVGLVPGTGQPDMVFVTRAVALCAVLIVLTAVCSYLMNVRL